MTDPPNREIEVARREAYAEEPEPEKICCCECDDWRHVMCAFGYCERDSDKPVSTDAGSKCFRNEIED